MPFSFLRKLRDKGFNRRELFQRGGLLAAGGLLGPAASPAAPALRYGAEIYQSIGVRPIINCQGVITIIGGSLTLPEVKRAMDDASNMYVHMDELADAIGARLGELTGSEWGMVASGCAAAMTHATSACIAGGNPERLQRLPDLTGLKNEVIIPTYCRNVYDHAIRMLGVKMIDVDDKAALERAIGPRTAMIYMTGPNKDFGVDVVASVAGPKGIPILVDCAAERLNVPNDHLKRGATLVAYSGGKLLRGPQCAGLLLGRKDLVRAAWYNSAPHHAFGRSMKVGKEEMMGMLAAVEMWMKRDHAAEWKQWEGWLDTIRTRVSKVPGVTTEIVVPETAVQPCPRLRISWDSAKVGITGAELQQQLLDGNPRIVVPVAGGNRGDQGPNVITLLPVMMSAGDEKPVAERLFALLSNPPKSPPRPAPSAPAANLTGQWTVRMDFISGNADHVWFLEQSGNDLRGTHKGEFLSGDLRGTIEGNRIHFRSSQKYEGSYLNYQFTGTLSGDSIQGVVNEMSTITAGEFGQAQFSARRHGYVEPRGPALNRPQKI